MKPNSTPYTHHHQNGRLIDDSSLAEFKLSTPKYNLDLCIKFANKTSARHVAVESKRACISDHK